MEQRCTVTGTTFTISQEELDFLSKVSPELNGKRYPLPPPSICPEERLRRRLSFRNLRNLYKRKCDLSGRSILSMYDENSTAPVFHTEEYWSDKWDALSYGRPFDFNRTFFEQFADLYNTVPRMHSYVIFSENCEYINGAANCRNCYLCFNMDYCEDCYYLHSSVRTKSTLESLCVSDCELCYSCTDCDRCYELYYSDLCTNCSQSYFLTGCKRCTNCIACSNLVGKEYHIFNQPCSREEFEALKASFRSRKAVEEFAKKAAQHSMKFPRKHYFGYANEAATGNAIHHLRNSSECYDSFELENCHHCYYVFKANNCMDFTIFGDNSQWMYECLAAGLNCSNDLFCAGCWSGSSFNIYCMTIGASSHCFGCASVYRKQYCVLNKQYSEAEYNELVPKIIEHMQRTGEWGQFFPPGISPFPFNETIGYEEYPLEKSEALRRGYNWKDVPARAPAAQHKAVPDLLDDVPDSITSETLVCEATGALFKVIPAELRFYRTMGVPLPRVAPVLRYQQLLERRTPRHLWDRFCEKCGKGVRSAYAPERREIVFCEQCYEEEVLR